MTLPRYQILVCRGPECGGRRHADDVAEALRAGLAADAELASRVNLDRWSCFGRCLSGVNVMVRKVSVGGAGGVGIGTRLQLMFAPTPGPGGALYHGVVPGDAARILATHVQKGEVLRDLTEPNRS